MWKEQSDNLRRKPSGGRKRCTEKRVLSVGNMWKSLHSKLGSDLWRRLCNGDYFKLKHVARH